MLVCADIYRGACIWVPWAESWCFRGYMVAFDTVSKPVPSLLLLSRCGVSNVIDLYSYENACIDARR